MLSQGIGFPPGLWCLVFALSVVRDFPWRNKNILLRMFQERRQGQTTGQLMSSQNWCLASLKVSVQGLHFLNKIFLFVCSYFCNFQVQVIIWQIYFSFYTPTKIYLVTETRAKRKKKTKTRDLIDKPSLELKSPPSTPKRSFPSSTPVPKLAAYWNQLGN